MLRSALLILSGNAVGSLLLLARNLIVARMISVEHYGIASTFAISMAIVEMMSALGLQQQIVQSRNGDDPHFQAALQGFQVLRGAIASAMLFVAADPLAMFFGLPDTAWAYQVMALVPLLNALQHFDIHRTNRHMQFLPGVITGIVPALISVVLLWPLSLWYDDFRVMLYALVAQSVLAVFTSHIVAERPYRLVLDRAIMKQSLHFGWPLLLNGVLMFFVFNGERIIIGRELGMEALAVFSMGMTLTLTPALVMAKSMQSFFLPQLSATGPEGGGNGKLFVHLAMATIQAGIVCGLVLVLAVALGGEAFVHGLLGNKYAGLLPLLTALAIMQAIRVAKEGGAALALSRRQTGSAMAANLFRILTLPVAWYVLVHGGSVIQMVWIAAAGELAGFAASLLLVRYRMHLSLCPNLLPVALASVFLLFAELGSWALTGAYSVHWGFPQHCAVLVLLFALALFAMTDLRAYAWRRAGVKIERQGRDGAFLP